MRKEFSPILSSTLLALLVACSKDQTPSTATEPPLIPSAATPTTMLPTAEAAPTATPEQVSLQQVFYKGVDIMKLTKDVQRNPLSLEDKQRIVALANELGATHVAVATPYDDAPGTNTLPDTREWVEEIHNAGLGVSHRHMFMGYEAIYDQPRNTDIDYVASMREWMITNQDLIQEGDIWTPMPEPQNAGIVGVNCNPQDQVCMFESRAKFNDFIRRLVTTSRETLQELGKENVEVICCGFDGFITAGNNNPDWEGKSFLEPETIAVLGHIAVDHYPQSDYATGEQRTYEEDINQFTEVWPNVPLYLTEVGSINNPNSESVESMFAAFEKHAQKGTLQGVFWWPFNPGSGEGLLNTDFTPNDLYYQVQQGFARLPVSAVQR